MTRRAILLKWILYCLCALALALLQGLVLVYVRVWGVHPFLLPAIAVIPATLERNEQALLYAVFFGLVCDLLSPVAGLPCFYALAFLLGAAAAWLLSGQVIMAGVVCSLVVTGVCMLLCGLLHPLVWAAVIVAALDQIGSAVLVGRYAAKHPVLEQLNQKLEARSDTLRRRIAVYVEKRIQRAYPEAARQQPTAVQKGKADFLSAADLLWLFVIGAFLGDLVETVFCRLTAGVWMSRSSLVWGPFSVVWGLALAMATVLLRQNQDKSDRYLFAFGTVLGGVYEYVCSAVTELLFGTVFWDYSGFKFNLGGRVNLLYCFFWGIAAVVWIRYGYPLVAKLMANLKKHILPWMTVVLTVFMAVNMGLSALALARYDARTSGVPAANAVETYLDAHFDNARMERIYPNAKKVEKAG